MKALKMQNPPHPGFSVRVDCLEPHGLSVTEGAKIRCVAVCVESSGEPECRPVLGDGYSLGQGVWQYAGGMMRLQFQYDAAQVEERSKKIKVKMFADVVHA